MTDQAEKKRLLNQIMDQTEEGRTIGGGMLRPTRPPSFRASPVVACATPGGAVRARTMVEGGIGFVKPPYKK